jgi:hypothetical protein
MSVGDLFVSLRKAIKLILLNLAELCHHIAELVSIEREPSSASVS